MNPFGLDMSPFFGWLLKTTVQGSVLIVMIVAIRWLLRGRLAARWQYALWLLLLIRLAMPWMPQSKLSLFGLAFTLVPRSNVSAETSDHMAGDEKLSIAEPTPMQGNGVILAGAETPPSTTATPEPLPVEQLPAISGVSSNVDPIDRVGKSNTLTALTAYLTWLWFAGALGLVAYIGFRNLHLWLCVTAERQLIDQEVLELLEDCKQQMRVKTPVTLVITEKISSPALFGFVRPRILLPQGLLEMVTLDELQYVFLHELAHLKRGDIYVSWLTAILQVLHWFNPLIWFGFRQMRTDQELACDALAMSRMAVEEPPQYGQTLVRLLERFSQPQYVPSVAGILEDSSRLERRITMIAKFKKSSYQRSPFATILIIILACFSLPDAPHVKASARSSAGIGLKQIWSDGTTDTGGTPSPDGKYLSFTDWATGDLALYEISTGEKRRLTNKGTQQESMEFAGPSCWSPDGTQIVYDWYNKDGFVEIRIIGKDKPEERILYRNEEVVWAQTFDWSPDGKHILAIFTHKDTTEQIVLVSVEDASVKVLKTLHAGWPTNMCFSPDSHFIAFDHRKDISASTSDISLFAIEEGKEIPLIEHPADDLLLGWAKDSKNILFASDRTGNYDLRRIQMLDGEPKGKSVLLKSDIGSRFIPLGFTSAGSFYYGISKGKEDVYGIRLDPKTGKILSPAQKLVQRFEGSNIMPYYSPDGKYLAYTSRRGARRHLHCIRSLETGQERDYIFDPKLAIAAVPYWSPDCRWLLAKGTDEQGRKGLFKIDVRTEEVMPIVFTGDKQIRSYAWASRGKAVIYAFSDGRLIVRDLESEAEKEIKTESSTFYSKISISPDGQRLALRGNLPEGRGEHAVLETVSINGGDARVLYQAEVPESIRSFAWTPDGNYILMSVDGGATGGKCSLYRIAVKDGKCQDLNFSMNPIGLINVHPDGQRVVFQSSGFNEEEDFTEVWKMDNFLPEMKNAKP